MKQEGWEFHISRGRTVNFQTGSRLRKRYAAWAALFPADFRQPIINMAEEKRVTRYFLKDDFNLSFAHFKTRVKETLINKIVVIKDFSDF